MSSELPLVKPGVQARGALGSGGWKDPQTGGHGVGGSGEQHYWGAGGRGEIYEEQRDVLAGKRGRRSSPRGLRISGKKGALISMKCGHRVQWERRNGAWEAASGGWTAGRISAPRGTGGSKCRWLLFKVQIRKR